MAARAKKDIIRVGDVVQVVTPMVVDRIGYPKSVKEYRPDFDTEIHKMVRDLEAKIYGREMRHHFKPFDVYNERRPSRFENQILDIVQYHMAKVDGFGGTKRSVHLRQEPKYANRRAKVIGRKVAQTGEYYPPETYRDSDYYSGEWYETVPGGLSNQKSVVLFGLDIENLCGQFSESGIDCWIPAENLKKIGDEHERKRVA